MSYFWSCMGIGEYMAQVRSRQQVILLHCWLDCIFKPDAWNKNKNSHYSETLVAWHRSRLGLDDFTLKMWAQLWCYFKKIPITQKFIISLKKLNLWHTSYFSWTKILWIACFWKKVRLRIKQLSWLDALPYKINRHHCNSILHCSSSFIWRQCSLWITGHQITYLQRNRKKHDQYFDPHSGNNLMKLD